MKTIRNAILSLWHWLLLAIAIFYSVSCSTVTVETTTTDAKSGLTTVTRTRRSAPDAAAYDMAAAVAALYAPSRAMVVREEKAHLDMPALFQGWQGRKEPAITPKEIDRRWKP